MEALGREGSMRADLTWSGVRVEEPSRGRKLTRSKVPHSSRVVKLSRSLSLDKRMIFDANGQSGERHLLNSYRNELSQYDSFFTLHHYV